LIRRSPSSDHVLPRFIDFLSNPDPIVPVHHVLFDLGLLAMALTRLGIAYPPHRLVDTLDLARRLPPMWPRQILEEVATNLKVA
jgi:DNA polymerase III epsilon subunit-like protein